MKERDAKPIGDLRIGEKFINLGETCERIGKREGTSIPVRSLDTKIVFYLNENVVVPLK